MSVYIDKIVKDLELHVLNEGGKDKSITVSSINRPGLQFAGFYNYFADERIQVIGMAEMNYLENLDEDVKKERIEKYFSFDIKCVIFARDLQPSDEMLRLAREKNIWILGSHKVTTRVISNLMGYLDGELAEETMIHGVLCDIYGLGILIVGDSGIGKSEVALELIRRGHRLVTDDAVNIRNIDGRLLGKSPYITEGMIEVRGLGIIDVPSLYGLSSVKEEKFIDFAIKLEKWEKGKNYERLGNSNKFMEILGVDIKEIVLPVMPGRNIAVIIETAAVNHRHNEKGEEMPISKIEKRMMESRKK